MLPDTDFWAQKSVTQHQVTYGASTTQLYSIMTDEDKDGEADVQMAFEKSKTVVYNKIMSVEITILAGKPQNPFSFLGEYIEDSWNALWGNARGEDRVFNGKLTEEMLDNKTFSNVYPSDITNMLTATYRKFTKITSKTFIGEQIEEKVTVFIIIIIWDHIKDDRLLTNQVQEFYWNLEDLIYTYYVFRLYKECFGAIQKIENNRLQPYKKKNYEDIDKNFSQRLIYLQEKARRGITEWGKYIGLLSKVEEQEKLNNILDNKYYSDTNIILNYTGELKNTLDEPLVKDYTKITEKKEGFQIYYYLRSLRGYWKKNYRKFLLRKKLKEKVKITGLFMDYQLMFLYLRKKNYNAILKYTNFRLKDIEDLLKGSMMKNPFI